MTSRQSYVFHPRYHSEKLRHISRLYFSYFCCIRTQKFTSVKIEEITSKLELRCQKLLTEKV